MADISEKFKQGNSEISHDDLSLVARVESLSATWTIRNFLSRDRKVLHSSVINGGTEDSNQWKLLILPKVDVSGLCYSVYLEMVSGKECTVKVVLSIVKYDNYIVKSDSFTEAFPKSGSYHGIDQFMTREDLINDKFPFLVQGNLTIQCTLNVKIPKYCRLIPNSFNMESVFKSKKFADATFIVQGRKSFSIHRAILSARSQYFAKLFEVNLQTKDVPLSRIEIEITDVDSDTMEEVLRYLYTGVTKPLSFDLAESLYFAADKYQLSDLKKICVHELVTKLSLENASRLFVLARDYNESELLSRAKALVQYL